MSKYYQVPRKTGNYEPGAKNPFRLSRSKVDLFLNCPRCFYLDRRLGIPPPPGYPFTLNTAVDELLKKDFDIHRLAGRAHPLMKKYGIKAKPLAHIKLNDWRDSLRKGVTFYHSRTGFFLTGGIDDVWISDDGELIVVDYKATAKKEEVNLDADWQIGYKRQMEFYQWLFRKNGFKVSDIGYFVYANGKKDKAAFDGRLEFDVKIIPYKGNDGWVENTIMKIKNVLESEKMPLPAEDCDFCKYREAVKKTIDVRKNP
ncbi:MAG: hypothetical protein CEN89_671 [Candidatus Berkelbacteria bacterium Licking1014_7]|uniref:PD-(D/E)XK endonuclease-like domain-containing protein n=1 Tax=Candidatus Berkelbacteria bacterium Licking1014_7 TaxID=2017147 RepID=A0A554LI04_9BACT|nr:MAG: hypothetical protein CEN89_671 [Candidatus Berkelbacteria bacterium Licking1014_7]